MPRPRMWRIRSSRSGCSIGSPPLKATTEVPSSASLSMRRIIDVGRHRRRHLVVLVAVAAVDVAAADRDDLDEQRVRGVGEPAHELAQPIAPCGWRWSATASMRRRSHSGVRISAGRSRRTRSPTFTDPLKIEPDRDEARRAGAARRPRGPPRRCSRSCCSRASPPNWHGVIFVVRSAEMRRRRAREHALVRRRGRLGVDVEQSLGRLELRDSAAAAPADRRPRAARSAGVSRSSETLADLRRVEADPDLSTSPAAPTRSAGTPRGSPGG